MAVQAIRTVVAIAYLLLAYVGAIAVSYAPDSMFTNVGFFAWNIACAALFSYVAGRTTGRSLSYTLVVALLGPILQLVTLDMIVAEVMGETFASALEGFPETLGRAIALRPALHAAWLGFPVIAAWGVPHLNQTRSRVDT